MLLCTLLWITVGLVVEVNGARSSVPNNRNTDSTQQVFTCARRPTGTSARKTPGDNGFRIQVTGKPPSDGYIGGKTYNVVVNGTYANQRLLGFVLVAVPQRAERESTTMGTFQHLDHGATRNHPGRGCGGAVTTRASGLSPRAGVEMRWTAPPSGSGCVEFRAAVIEHRDIWYKDDGALTLLLCENQMGDEGGGESMSECCACGTGKYQMTFTGHWSRHTHPKDYPTHKRLLHWSNIVGMSHGPEYQIWQYGTPASKGIKEVCEFGYPRTLEQEMRDHSANIRTVIKTPGIWWRDPNGLRQTRWARFSVDRHKHLLSMITMLGPSPDWCAGVSSLNLCLPNCTWAASKRIELYPFDAGTDDGITYMSRNTKSEPQQMIHRITNSFPADPLSPFYGPLPIAPLATLELRRIHPKAGASQNVCTGNETIEPSDINEGVTGQLDLYTSGQDDDLSEMDHQKILLMQGGKCVLSEWNEWSECSVTCGVGQRVRKRGFLMTGVNKAMCPGSPPLLEVENCIGLENECFLGSSSDDSTAGRQQCATSTWSDWSPCSVTCGQGTRERRKFYLNKMDMDTCSQNTQQQEACMADSASCARKNFTAICGLPKEVGSCRGSFTRWYYNTNLKKCMAFTYGGCRGNNNRFRTAEECNATCKRVMATTTAHPDHMEYPMNEQEAGNVRDEPTFVETITRRPQEQHQGVSLAPTPTEQLITENRGSSSRSVDCKVTSWTSWSACSSSCGRGYKTRHRMIQREARNGGEPCPTKLEKRKKCTMPRCPTSCKLGSWSSWSHCGATCGTEHVQERSRAMVQRPREGGRPCPAKLQRRFCELPLCDGDSGNVRPRRIKTTRRQRRKKKTRRLRVPRDN